MYRRRTFPKATQSKPVKRITPDSLASTGTEHGHQCALFCYIRQEAPHVLPSNIAASLNRLFAIPNGGERHAAVAGKMKAEGVKAGVLDTFLPVPLGDACGLFLEMKAPGKLKNTSSEQDDWIACLRENYAVYVCDHWADAAATLLTYLTGTVYNRLTLPRRIYPS